MLERVQQSAAAAANGIYHLALKPSDAGLIEELRASVSLSLLRGTQIMNKPKTKLVPKKLETCIGRSEYAMKW